MSIDLSSASICSWGKESVEARLERSARLLNIWGMLPTAEYRKVVARIRKAKGIPTANNKGKK